MADLTCSTCPAFNPFGTAQGECRWEPPSIPASELESELAGWSWPHVEANDWCVEHPGRRHRMDGAAPHGQEGEDLPTPEQPDSHEVAPRLAETWDRLLRAARSWVGSGIQHVQGRNWCVWVYVRTNSEEEAQQLRDDLLARDIRCFYAPEDMKTGLLWPRGTKQKYPPTIGK